MKQQSHPANPESKTPKEGTSTCTGQGSRQLSLSVAAQPGSEESIVLVHWVHHDNPLFQPGVWVQIVKTDEDIWFHAISPVNEVIGAQLPSEEAASATSHSFRVLSVEALMTWLLPTQRTYDTALVWPPITAKGAEICTSKAQLAAGHIQRCSDVSCNDCESS